MLTCGQAPFISVPHLVLSCYPLCFSLSLDVVQTVDMEEQSTPHTHTHTHITHTHTHTHTPLLWSPVEITMVHTTSCVHDVVHTRQQLMIVLVNQSQTIILLLEKLGKGRGVEAIKGSYKGVSIKDGITKEGQHTRCFLRFCLMCTKFLGGRLSTDGFILRSCSKQQTISWNHEIQCTLYKLSSLSMP